ncbi:MAG: hypothetical protein ACREFD_05645 [Stellaceae bacterium]
MTDLPFVHPTVVHMLQDAAAKNPDGEALVCGMERLSYVQYLGAVAAFAKELKAEGMAGRRIALLIGILDAQNLRHRERDCAHALSSLWQRRWASERRHCAGSRRGRGGNLKVA